MRPFSPHTQLDSGAPVPDVFGRYELGDLLGRGGMGEVYRARDTVRGRWVALKVLPAHLADDENFAARFRRESRLAAQLNEPHIIPIHDFGEIDGRLFIDMRLVEGRDLSSVLDASGPLSPEVAVDVVGQMAAALDAAHAGGLVHRDVKPSNILLTGLRDDPEHVPFAYLVDFGIARSSDQMTQLTTTSSAAIGTLAYMAPERISGLPGDHRADVYALACVLYEALTGSAPFTGETFAVMYAHVHAPVPAASAVRPQVPTALDDVVAKGMAKDPDDRYASAGAFAAAARRAVRGSSGPVPPMPDPQATVHISPEARVPTAPAVSRTPAPDPSGPTVVNPPPPRHPPPAGTAPQPHRPRRRRAWLAAVAVLVVALAGVGVVLLTRGGGTGGAQAGGTSGGPSTKAGSAPPSAGSSAVAGTPRAGVKDGGTMTWALTSHIADFNPLSQDGDTEDDATVTGALLPHPFHFDATGTPTTDTDYFTSIAEMSADPLTVEYRINPAAKWSDGTAITYEDFAAQRAAVAAGSGSGFEVADLVGYDRIASVAKGSDDRDVRVTFSGRYADWRSLFTPLLPRSLTSSAETFDSAWRSGPTVTAGPFRWAGATDGRYRVVRDRNWWGAPAKLDRIDFVPFADQSAAVAALGRHGADFVNLSGVNAATNAVTVRGFAGVAVRSGPGTNLRMLTMNTRDPVLSDVRVRRAVLLGLDRAAIAAAVVGSLPGEHDPLQNHFFVRGEHGYEDTCGDYCSYAPDRSASLLQRAGWTRDGDYFAKDGARLTLTLAVPTRVPAILAEARAAQTSLKRAGIELRIQQVGGGQVADLVAAGRFQLATSTVFGSRFPLSALGAAYSDGDGQPSADNPGAGGTRASTVAIAAGLGAPDAAQADAKANAASALLWADAAFVPLYQRPQVTGVTASLVNLGAAGFTDVRYEDIGYRA